MTASELYASSTHSNSSLLVHSYLQNQQKKKQKQTCSEQWIERTPLLNVSDGKKMLSSSFKWGPM